MLFEDEWSNQPGTEEFCFMVRGIFLQLFPFWEAVGSQMVIAEVEQRQSVSHMEEVVPVIILG